MILLTTFYMSRTVCTILIIIMMMIKVPCNDKAYSWLLEWVAREAAKSSLHVSVRWNSNHHYDDGPGKEKHDEEFQTVFTLRTQWEEEEGGRVSAK